MAGNLPAGRPTQSTQKWRNRATQLWQHVFSDEDLIEILEVVKQGAKDGDIDHLRLVFDYSFTKARPDDQRFNLGADGDINIMINQLSDDQLRALKAIDASVTSAQSHALPDPEHR